MDARDYPIRHFEYMAKRSPTIEELEREVWAAPKVDSYLVGTIHALRRKPIAEFTVEDLRIMLGQNCGIEHLTPLALDRLEIDPFLAGDFYPGDLLSAVMGIPPHYWSAHLSAAERMDAIAHRATHELPRRGITDEIKAHLRELIAAAPWRSA